MDYLGWFESANMLLLEFPPTGESGSSSEIVTDTQISDSLVVITYPTMVILKW